MHRILSKAQTELKKGTFSDDSFRYFAERIALKHKVKSNRDFLEQAVNGTSLSDVVLKHKNKQNSYSFSNALFWSLNFENLDGDYN